jgi:two-component system, OmpR family, sensor histidine kinase QseC
VERYHAALSRERGLAGEFAHELRTPIASMSLQAHALAALPAGAEREDAVARLADDARRASEVLSHLLALARASRAELEDTARPVELQALAQELLADFGPAADASGHTLALSCPGPLVVQGHPVLLEIALRNLLENALAHTPRGTQVEVRIDPVLRCMAVCDMPGLAGDETDVAVAPRRALGLGLGHRVIDKIAEVHGARFDSAVGSADGGRCYAIRFP